MSRTRHRSARPLAPQKARTGGGKHGDALRRKFVARDGGRVVLDADAQTERRWLSGCRGKVAFETQRIAERERPAAEARAGNALEIYRCRTCGRFHYATDYVRLRQDRRDLEHLIRVLEDHLRARGFDV